MLNVCPAQNSETPQKSLGSCCSIGLYKTEAQLSHVCHLVVNGDMTTHNESRRTFAVWHLQIAVKKMMRMNSEKEKLLCVMYLCLAYKNSTWYLRNIQEAVLVLILQNVMLRNNTNRLTGACECKLQLTQLNSTGRSCLFPASKFCAQSKGEGRKVIHKV